MRCTLLIFLAVLAMPNLSAQQKDLDYFLGTALQNSPLLADYQNRIKSAQYDSLRFQASRQFQVKAVSNNYYAPVVNGWGLDEAVTDGANLTGLVEVTRDFMGRSHFQNRILSLQMQKQGDKLEGNLSTQELRRNVITQYIAVYGAQQQYLLGTGILDLLKEQEKWVKQLAEAGIYRQTEYLSLLVNLHQQELQTRQAFIQCRVEQGTLNYICGIVDTAYIVLPDPAITAFVLPDVRSTLPYRQYETDSMKLVLADRQIDFDYKPKLSVFADGGYLSSLTYMPWRNFGAMAGISLTVPLYDGGQKKMQHDQIAISQETKSGYMKFYRNQYQQQVLMLQRQLLDYGKLEKESAVQLEYARSLVEANHKLVNSGDIPITEYVLSVNNYIDAKNIQLQHILTRYLIVNEINYWSHSK